MGEVCDICGHKGWDEFIYTCSKCRIAREHTYCMRILPSESFKNLVCDMCSMKPAENNATNPAKERVFKQPGNDKSSGHLVKPVSRWQRNPDRGKVKLISAEEVIRLSSGTPKKTCPSSNVCRRFVSSDSAPGFAGQTMCGPSATKPESNFGNLKPNLSGKRKSRAVEHGAQHATTPREAAEGKRAPIAVARKSSGREVVKRKVRFKELTTCYANAENINDNPGGNVDAATGAEALPVHLFRQYCPFLPARNPTWKGSFLVSSSAAPQERYEGILAQSPCRVHRKVFEFSKTMPSVHQVELLPKDKVLMDVFENEMPDLSDVAFYFFPDETIKRSKENNACLFKFMEVQKSVIRSSMNGVELFIFTSKQLNEVSQSIISMQKYNRGFLWGVLRRIRKFPSQNLLLESVCCDTNGVESQEAIDMDIDMKGGHDLDNVDVKLPQKTSGVACERSKQETGASKYFVQQIKMEEETYQEKFRMQTCTASTMNCDVPPGFETTPKFKSRNASSNGAVVEKDFEQRNQTPEKRETRFPHAKDYVKLNVAASATASSSTYGSAGIVRDEFGKWVFGYILNLEHTTSLSAEFWGLFQGLKLAWLKGYRGILVESANPAALEAFTQDPSMMVANKHIIQQCKDIISRSWDCRVCCISTAQNACTNWLANQFEEYPLGLTIFDRPFGSLIPLLEDGKDEETSK